MEESRADLVASRDAGDDEAVADVRADWRYRLRRTLRADPAMAAELHPPHDESAPAADQAKGATYSTFSGSVQQGIVIQAHTIRDMTTGKP